jgi:hypothetical protein
MTAVAHELPARNRQQLVAALLDQIEELRQRIYLAQANGVLAAGVRDLKGDLRGLREELARTVSAAGSRAR